LSSSIAATAGIGGVKAGLCPHGLPPGACPICSGMGGGSKVRTADFSAKPGEMSWNECAAIGAFLRAQQLAAQNRLADFNSHILAMAKFEASMANLSAQLTAFIKNASASKVLAPVVFVAKNIMLPVVNMLKNMPTAILNSSAVIAQKFADISDKLAAVFGELKAKMNKKAEELAKTVKKKITSIFEKIFGLEESYDEEQKIEEEKRIFELKSFLEKIYDKLKREYAYDEQQN